MSQDDYSSLLQRFETLLTRAEQWLPPARAPLDWNTCFAARRRYGRGWGSPLQAVTRLHPIALQDLQGVDAQKEILQRNTRQFVRGLPANNALLWGAKGTGKSSLIKALLNAYRGAGLRLVQIDKQYLPELPDISDELAAQPWRFIVFCDDLSFEADDPGYKALKSLLDGSLSAPPENLLIYATSNRRHLLPEYQKENQEARHIDGELHPGETVEEKISLSERFGLWLSFYPFKQDEYLDIVYYWVKQLGGTDLDHPELRRAALQWALARGSRSGRAAQQFACDWVGRAALD